ncbi:MAG TPA: hypothetical protein DCY38_02015 [Opitutae bacterium]|nr:hypothetical protein [Opitutae bacterium]
MSKIVHFPRWAEVLRVSNLEPKEREGFKVTIRWYFVTAKVQARGRRLWCLRHQLRVGSGK